MTDTTALRDLLVNARAEIELMKRGLAELERRLVIQECMEHGRPIPAGSTVRGGLKRSEMMEGISVPCKVWQPFGPSLKVMTCATHEEIAGSIVQDSLDIGLLEVGDAAKEYWDMVVSGYRGTIRWHNNVATARMANEYAASWISRCAEYWDSK